MKPPELPLGRVVVFSLPRFPAGQVFQAHHGIKAFCGRNWGSEMSNYARRSPGPNRLMVASVPPRSSVHVFPISNPSKERTRRSAGHCRLGLTNLREMLPMRRTTS